MKKLFAYKGAVQAAKSIHNAAETAEKYADFLEKKTGQRPIIFMTNGYETRMWSDKYYPERQVSGFYSKRDLEK